MMPQKLKRAALNSFLVLSSTMLTLVGVELMLRVIQPGPLPRIEPQVRHVFVQPDPAIGRLVDYHYLAPNQKAFNFTVSVSTNSIGIRNPEIPIVKLAGGYRILALGDSHTFGYGVEDDQSWPRKLEAKLRLSPLSKQRSFEVINAGIAGLSLAQEVQFLRERLLHLHPDLIVLGYYWDDMPTEGDPFADLSEQNMGPQGQGNSTTPGLEVSRENAGRSYLIGPLMDLLRKSYLLYSIVQRVPYLQMNFFPGAQTKWKRATVEGRTSPKIEASWKFVERKIAELKQLGQDNGFELVVLMIPLFEQMTSPRYSVTSYQTKLTQICDAQGIAIIDPLPAIRAIHPSYPDYFIPFDGHPNGKVYEVIADAVLKWLARKLGEETRFTQVGQQTGGIR